jgi:hypothetical protein
VRTIGASMPRHLSISGRSQVGALLGSTENMARLSKLREEYDAQRTAVEVQISLLTGRQAEEARAGLALIKSCQEWPKYPRVILFRLRSRTQRICAVRQERVAKVGALKTGLEKRVEESEQALPGYTLVRRAMAVRRNLQRVVSDLDSVITMPLELGRIEKVTQSPVARKRGPVSCGS